MSGKIPIQSTAGAIPVRNEKGEFTMEKVKVSRYVSGKRPDYAPQESSDEDEDFEFGIKQKKAAGLPTMKTLAERDDRRLKRLQERQTEDAEPDEDKLELMARRRALHEPEVLADGSDEEEEDEPHEEAERKEQEMEESSGEEEEELDEEEIERRRALLRQRAQQQRDEEEIMDLEDEKSEEGSEEESSEYEEYTDSEEEETGPRLKPVFVRKKDRVTIQEKEKEAERQKILEIEAKKMADERRRQTLKLVEEEARKELQEMKGVQDACDLLNSDDDNDEEEYEAWKLRELKRIKRDKEERENTEKEKLDLDRIHNMTEEERRNEMRLNPKVITNKATKGKYKFLQKYYHRGAFFMEQEDNVYKQDFSAPTLEDHFDKTILPKVMQVKNFGRSGRTKYTHLVDQDTTSFDSPWASDTTQNLKFHTSKGGGMKQVFDRPSTLKKRK